MSWLESIPRRRTYPAIAAVLAVGAPIGLAVVRAATSDDAGLAALARSVREDLPAFVSNVGRVAGAAGLSVAPAEIDAP